MSLINRMNSRVKGIQISDIRQFDAEVSQIPEMIKLTIGEPDFPTPTHVKEAGVRAIEENFTRYSGMSGFLDVREAAAAFMKEKYGVSYQPETEILTTIGATEALSASLLTILEAGDKVLVPTPIYPGYLPLITLAGAEPVFLDTTKTAFVLTPNLVESAIVEHGESVKAIILNYPSNPTGVTYAREEIAALAEVFAKYEIFVLSDEIYSELTYGEAHVSFGEYLFDQTIVINGLSKSHSMTGWRIGFTFAPEAITKELIKTHQYLVTAASSISQKAAVEALTVGKDDGIFMRKEYEKRRDFVVQEMKALGFESARPNGAFYLFAKIPEGLMQHSFDFCRDLAVKGKVALIPGVAFGEAGEGYVRLSYAASMEQLVEAMKRLKTYVMSEKSDDF